MGEWLADLKDSDKVAIAILLLGVAVTFASTLGVIAVIFHSAHIDVAETTRAISVIKDFFGVGTGLIGAALLALKLQPKNGSAASPPDAKPPVKWP